MRAIQKASPLPPPPDAPATGRSSFRPEELSDGACDSARCWRSPCWRSRCSSRGRAGRRPHRHHRDAGTRRYRAAVQRFARQGGDGRAARGARAQGGAATALEFSGLFARIDERAFLERAQSPRLDGAPASNCPNWRQIGADALVQGEVDAARRRRARRVPRSGTSRAAARRSCAASASPVATRTRGASARRIADDVVERLHRPARRRGHRDRLRLQPRRQQGDLRDGRGRRRTHAPPRATGRSTPFPTGRPTASDRLHLAIATAIGRSCSCSRAAPNSPGRILAGLNGGAPDLPRRLRPAAGAARGRDERRRRHRDLHGGARRRRAAAPHQERRDRRLAELVARRQPHRLRVGSHRRAAGLRDERGRQRASAGSPSRATTTPRPAWSPDGRWIAYETRVGGQFDIWLIDPEGQANVPLVDAPAQRRGTRPGRPTAASSPSSPTRRGRADIYVMDVERQSDRAPRHERAARTRIRPGGRTGASRRGEEGDDDRSRSAARALALAALPALRAAAWRSRSSASSSTRCAR